MYVGGSNIIRPTRNYLNSLNESYLISQKSNARLLEANSKMVSMIDNDDISTMHNEIKSFLNQVNIYEQDCIETLGGVDNHGYMLGKDNQDYPMTRLHVLDGGRLSHELNESANRVKAVISTLHPDISTVDMVFEARPSPYSPDIIETWQTHLDYLPLVNVCVIFNQIESEILTLEQEILLHGIND